MIATTYQLYSQHQAACFELLITTRKVVGAECRHDMQPSVQLLRVSGSDSKLGLTVD